MDKRTVVVTAIFGQAEAIPAVANPDPRLTYLLYTDGVVKDAPPPWQVRTVPSIFRDSVRDARRLKLLPHLFLPDFDLSVWIDATCDILDLNLETVTTLLGNANMALLEHPFTSCLYEEAKTVTKWGLDAEGRVARQITAYRAAGMPEANGLYATGFMIRRHNDIASKRFDNLWWEQLVLHSRRDQISAPYVDWLLGANVKHLPLSLTENPVFRWHPVRGPRPGEPRKRPRPESIGSAYRDLPGNATTHSEYQARFDSWPPEFTRQLLRLNERVAEVTTSLEGSALYPDGECHFQYAPPDPRIGPEREVFLQAIAGRTHLLQIGFSAGHAALLSLTHVGARVTSIALGRNARNLAAAKFLGQEIPDRFEILWLEDDHSEAIGFDAFDAIHLGRAVPTEIRDAIVEAIDAKARQGTVVVVEQPVAFGNLDTSRQVASSGRLAPMNNLQAAGAAAFTIT